MSESGETVDFSQSDSDQWRNKLPKSYIDQGFDVHSVVPKPPLRPMRRVITSTSPTYDYHSALLEMSAEDEALTAAHNKMMRELRDEHGEENVVTAFPTDEMLQADPELGIDTHLVIMVRQRQDLSE